MIKRLEKKIEELNESKKELEDLQQILPQAIKYDLITLLFKDDKLPEEQKELRRISRDIQAVVKFLISNRPNNDVENMQSIIARLIEKNVLTGSMEGYQKVIRRDKKR